MSLYRRVMIISGEEDREFYEDIAKAITGLRDRWIRNSPSAKDESAMPLKTISFNMTVHGTDGDGLAIWGTSAGYWERER